MSKIGKRPVKIEDGVNVSIEDHKAVVSSDGKTLSFDLPKEVKVTVLDGNVIVDRLGNSKDAKSKHGLVARLIANMIHGVKEGFTKELTFTGTGYRASINDNELVLYMGYSHDVKLPVPSGLEVKVVKNTILVSGIEKAAVGQFAAVVREVRPPEVYKGKGIRYKDEHIRRKAGKTAASK